MSATVGVCAFKRTVAIVPRDRTGDRNLFPGRETCAGTATGSARVSAHAEAEKRELGRLACGYAIGHVGGHAIVEK